MSEQPEGTQLVTQLGDAVGGPEVPGPDPETETVDLRRKLWNVQRLGESMAEDRDETVRRCGEQVLAVLGDAALPVAAALTVAAGLVMRYERWRDANQADRLDPVLGPEIQIDLGQWAEQAAAVLARLLEHADPSPFAAAALERPTIDSEASASDDTGRAVTSAHGKPRERAGAVAGEGSDGSEERAAERVRALAQSWASLPHQEDDRAEHLAEIDRRVGAVILAALDSGTAADVRLSRVAALAEDWMMPGGPGLFCPAAGQAVLDAIRGASTDEEADWRERAEAAEGKVATLEQHLGAVMDALGVAEVSAAYDYKKRVYRAAAEAFTGILAKIGSEGESHG